MTKAHAISAPHSPDEQFNHLWHLVGNTPMLEIHYSYQGREGQIYVKCEHYNLTGSVKDRMALFILHKAWCAGLLKPGDIIAEATSGNTGISLAAIGKSLGYPVTIVMPDWLSRERSDILKSLGVNVIPISKEEGGFRGAIEMTERLAQKGNVFLPRQLGLAVGISSGANLIGAIQLADRLGPEATVVTLPADSNKKYLNTDLMGEEPVQPHYYSTDTVFHHYRPIQRLGAPVIPAN